MGLRPVKIISLILSRVWLWGGGGAKTGGPQEKPPGHPPVSHMIFFFSHYFILKFYICKIIQRRRERGIFFNKNYLDQSLKHCGHLD